LFIIGLALNVWLPSGCLSDVNRTHDSVLNGFFYLAPMIIKFAKYIISSPDYTQCPGPDRPEYAFIGRSNVGKSSLINMLCDNHKLAKTSGTPGKTQLINHFEVVSSGSSDKGDKTLNWYLVDLPGYGFAKVSQNARNRWEQMIENYLRKRENLLNVFVLIDSRHNPQKIDLEFVDQLGKWGIPFCLVFTKADKETQKTVSKNVKDFLDEMRKTWQFLPQHFVTSAIKKHGRDKILQFIQECNDEYGELKA
jgi:GTP-binding protein